MFEEMIQKLRDSVRGIVLDSMHDYISNDGKYPLALTQKQVMELIGCKDESTFAISFKEHLKFAEMSYGKSGTKWSRDLVIEWFKEPRNLQLQRRGK
ncbi:hypothetical protein [Lactococcus lactis]|uniref:hypothetical protein n=1 Tax=Lactococcus lactis TaxID=1358 RepID=UPI0022E88B4F|nr:hypothetical protein [Lactococcus lactis]